VATESPWPSILQRRRVLVCAGPGGVGKTTTAAALAVLGARSGRRVAALTVDPARRLADSLGIRDPGARAEELDPRVWQAPGQAASGGRLSVMMMDTKRTFDELIERHASSPEARDRILNNRLYGYVSAHLAGAHEYMAMEKLLSVSRDGAFDLIVLDTPPTRDALDFLSAPERLVGALDSSVLGWLGQALHPSRGLTLGLLARGVSRILGTMGRITGRELLEQLARFIVDVNELFGGFRQRATAVAQAFRGSEFGFVLVSSPRAAALGEGLRLGRQLYLEGMTLDGLVVNRMPLAGGSANSAEVAQALSERLPHWEPAAASASLEAIVRVAAQQSARSRDSLERVAALRTQLEALGRTPAPALFLLPELPANVQGIASLHELAQALLRPLEPAVTRTP
jgi:anion-transporting  ArsA/GET3 family ATPase